MDKDPILRAVGVAALGLGVAVRGLLARRIGHVLVTERCEGGPQLQVEHPGLDDGPEARLVDLQQLVPFLECVVVVAFAVEVERARAKIDDGTFLDLRLEFLLLAHEAALLALGKFAQRVPRDATPFTGLIALPGYRTDYNLTYTHSNVGLRCVRGL